MRYSQLFSKTSKQPPKEADTINHKLLTQAGYVDQLMAGVYSYLPLGLRVLNNISQVVREEMDAIGGQEVLMPILHPKQNWIQTGAWDKVDVLFKINSRTEKEYALAQSAEEVVAPLVLSRVNSYKDLPLYVYQIQWKYRDELRAKSGILRGREFLMKDMYSFHATQEDFLSFYEVSKKAYLKIFSRLGLTAKATEASGGNFTDKVSYEFMVLTGAGEDDILYCTECDFCVNKQIAQVKLGESCHRCGRGKFEEATASEVGNIFDLGQKYPKDFGFMVTLENGEKVYPFMGCYGIGITRLMGVLVEKFHDEKGIVWPDIVAPFKVHLLGLDLEDEGTLKKVEKVYQLLQIEGIEVLFDDREKVSAGQKFAEADLMGIPYRVIVSKKSPSTSSGQAADRLEVKRRDQKETRFLTLEELVKSVQKVKS